MQGTFFLGDGRFETRPLTSRPLGPHDVRIQNQVAGICGTDIHIYHGEEGSAAVVPPVVLGHEYTGLVIETGKEVSTLKIGDKVTVDPNIYCGRCYYCKTGRKQHCENMVAIGVNFDGGFQQESIVPESQCLVLAPDVSYAAGALAEPLSCCIHGMDLAGVHTGDTVCVIGGGAIGLLMVQLCKLSGASTVILSEPVAKRRELGLMLGADFAVDPVSEPLAPKVQQLLGRAGADVVIECVGKTAATQQAFEAAGFGATVLLFSVPSPGASAQLPLFDVFKKELKIKGSFINPDTQQRAVHLINAHLIKTEELITHRFPLHQVEEALQMQMSSESIKVVIEPWQEMK